MAKKYRNLKKKKKKVETAQTVNEPRSRRFITPEERSQYRKLMLFLVFWSIFLSTIYYTCAKLEFHPIMPIFTALGVIFFFVYVYFNGGIRRTDPANLIKPDYMGYDEFEIFLRNFKKRRQFAKYWFAAFIPFPMIMGIDYTIMVWAEKLSR